MSKPSRKIPPKTPKNRTYTYGAGGKTHTATYPTPRERKIATKRHLKRP